MLLPRETDVGWSEIVEGVAKLATRTKSSPSTHEERPAFCLQVLTTPDFHLARDSDADKAKAETIAFHPIACESCRNKKSKCDRELPACSQCTSAGFSCRFPPINKRGIPSGYLSYIEQRLFETELVVLELLSAFYNSPIPIKAQRLSDTDRQSLAENSQKQPKTARIEEWKTLPLGTDEQRHQWWLNRCALIAQPFDSASKHVSQESPAQHESWPDTSPTSVQHDDAQYPPTIESTAQRLTPVSTWPSNFGFEISTISAFPDQSQSATTTAVTQEMSNGDTSRLLSDTVIGTAYASSSLSGEKWRKYF